MSLRQIFKKAQKNEWAIGHFNFSSLEQMRAIIYAAKRLNAPVMLATSEGESKFMGIEESVAMKKALEQKIDIDLFLHLDHGKDLSYIKRAIDKGYDSVHFDGSSLPFEKNVELAKEIVVYARKKNVFVEGELGYLRGESTYSEKKYPKVSEKDMTKPEKAREFVERTGVDLLAISVGNIHGIYQGMPCLDFGRIQKIKQETGKPLVLHGGSGISNIDIKKAIRNGICKININTELRKIWREELEASLRRENTIKPYIILPIVIQKIQNRVEKYIKLFGSNGQSK